MASARRAIGPGGLSNAVNVSCRGRSTETVRARPSMRPRVEHSPPAAQRPWGWGPGSGRRYAARAVASLLLSAFLGAPAAAHGGGLNAEGCHNDRKSGGYHCHRSPSPRAGAAPARTNGFAGPRRTEAFANCAAARAAGAAPIRRGEAGYGSHLDRDGDGIACEPYRGRR